MALCARLAVLLLCLHAAAASRQHVVGERLTLAGLRAGCLRTLGRRPAAGGRASVPRGLGRPDPLAPLPPRREERGHLDGQSGPTVGEVRYRRRRRRPAPPRKRDCCRLLHVATRLQQPRLLDTASFCAVLSSGRYHPPACRRAVVAMPSFPSSITSKLAPPLPCACPSTHACPCRPHHYSRSLLVRTPSNLRVHVLPNPELRRAFASIQTGQDINVTGIWLSRGAGAARSAAAASANAIGSHAGGHAHAALLPPALQRMQMASAWAAAGSGGNTSLVKAASVAPNALSVYCFMPSVMQISGGKQATARVSGERSMHSSCMTGC